MLNLRDFKGGNTRNRLNYGHDKVGVYMSAFSDSVDLLSNMYIISDNNATHVSLNDLKALRMVSNELVPYPIDNTTYLTSSLSDEQIDQLTGVMFICSVKQLGDINFHVKDASYPLTTHFLNYGAADFTILFLNTNVNQFSNQSTTISQWEQNSGSSVYLYIGYPLDQPEEENSHVFSNPMKFNGSDMFFPNVEKFALTDVSFYFRTFKGGPNFKVDPGFFNVDGSVTTAYTTTGFYSKPVGEADSTKTINTSRDTKYSGFTGANIIGFLPNGGNVTYTEYDGDQSVYVA
ncbi:hypothetical protein GCK72_020942 [Caenorhabditis remanei]|uniref:Uncharacterized protein n=1 Tax=Caenorhabditis remanei TaxID=31234 RepID=A0A6A5GIF6_CAERE|nr:hypothetical protein GCK72_020942 [Caenorhabditis remanei]KAF1754381.1 hypothetical protein GCK72_020942 [Caenorhabditis remanei]